MGVSPMYTTGVSPVAFFCFLFLTKLRKRDEGKRQQPKKKKKKKE